MTALLMLKYLHNLIDECVGAMWQENAYDQHFSGETIPQWNQPCAVSDLVHFRHRLGMLRKPTGL